jgi:NTE family protein
MRRAWMGTRALRPCEQHARDWRRTVLGPRDATVSLSAALAASCAVPGYFAGVTLDGDSFVDGGVVSATNADLLADFDLDLVIVISPMTGYSQWPSVSRAVRHSCRRILNTELRSLRRAGVPAVVIEPSVSVTRHMSMNFMSETTTAEIVRAAFFDTGIQITRSPLLSSLSTRNVV